MEAFSQAADNNKAPILEVLSEWLSPAAQVLEIGSGSGQHAIHFAGALDHVSWQPTERGASMPALCANVQRLGSANILAPLELDLEDEDWPLEAVDCVYSANVLHIVRPELGERLIRGAAAVLQTGGSLALYGPFKYEGEFTTPSNASFDDWLKERSADSGIRDFEWVCDVAAAAGLELKEDRAMPSNNQFLRFLAG